MCRGFLCSHSLRNVARAYNNGQVDQQFYRRKSERQRTEKRQPYPISNEVSRSFATRRRRRAHSFGTAGTRSFRRCLRLMVVPAGPADERGD
jgi:hypothetical protein